MIQYISDTDHYTEILKRGFSVRTALWIGTADIKDLYIEKGKERIPFLGILAGLIKKAFPCALSMPKSPAQTSARTSIAILCWQKVWSVCSVHGCISR